MPDEISEIDFYEQIGLTDDEMLTDLSPDRLKKAFNQIVKTEEDNFRKIKNFLTKVSPHIKKLQAAGIDVALTQPDTNYFQKHQIEDYSKKDVLTLNIYDRDYLIFVVDDNNFKMSDFIVNKHRRASRISMFDLRNHDKDTVSFNLESKESIETLMGQLLITAAECAMEASVQEFTIPKADADKKPAQQKKAAPAIKFQAKKS